MANYQTLKAAIQAAIKQNGSQDITGNGLQTQLLNMINSLGAGYLCMGVATPTTNPGTPDQNVFYIAGTPGTYTNFNGAVVDAGCSLLVWNGAWTVMKYMSIVNDLKTGGEGNALSAEQGKNLSQEINELNGWKSGSLHILSYTLTEGNTKGNAEFSAIYDSLSIKTGYQYILSGKVNESDTWTTIVGAWKTDNTDLSNLNYNYYKVTIRNSNATSLINEDLSDVVTLVLRESYPKNTESILAEASEMIHELVDWKNGDIYLTEYTQSGTTRTYYYTDKKIKAIFVKEGYQIAVYGRNNETDSWSNIQGAWTSNYYVMPTSPVYKYTRISLRNATDTSMAGTDFTKVIRIRLIDELLNDVLSIIDSPVYVATDGDDQNDGTINNPLKSIQYAINTGRPIVVRGGIYTVSELDLNLVDKISIESYPNERVIFFSGVKIAEADGSLVSGYTKVYSLNVGKTFNYSSLHWIHQYGVNDPGTLISADERTAYHARKTHRCDSTTLSQVSSVSAVENADGYSFYYDSTNGVLYYSRPSALSQANFLFYPRSGGLFKTTTISQKAINMIGIEIYGVGVNLTSVRPSALTSCKVFASRTGYGFQINDAKGVVLKKCEAARVEDGASASTGDGFNMHTSGTVPRLGYCTVFTLDQCWSHDNWNDGYSDHGGCEGFINGGLFEYNAIGGQGAGLTPAYGAHDVIVDAICQNNHTIGLRYTSTGGSHDLASITVNGVLSRNNAYAGFYANESVDYVTFIGCIAYGNEYGFNNGGAASFKCINCHSVDNSLSNYNGTIDQI